MPFTALKKVPYRVRLQICQYLNYYSILRLSQVCKAARAMTQEQDLDYIMLRNTPKTEFAEHAIDIQTLKVHDLLQRIMFEGGSETEIQELMVILMDTEDDKAVKLLDCGALNDMAVWPPVPSLRVDMGPGMYLGILALASTMKMVRRRTGVRVKDVVKLMVKMENGLVRRHGFESYRVAFTGFSPRIGEDGGLVLVAGWNS